MDDDAEASEVYDEDDIEGESLSSSATDFGKWAGVVAGLRQFLCLSTVVLLPFYFPMYYQLSGVFLPTVRDHYELFVKVTVYLIRFFVSTTMLIVYILLSAVFIKIFGRKRSIIFCNVSHLLLALFTYFFYNQHQLGAFLVIYFYFLKECSTMIFYIYIAEIANPAFRLFYMGFFALAHTSGSVVTNHYLQLGFQIKPLFTWAILSAACASFGSIFIPESPFWLATKGNVEAAERNYSWIRAGSTSASDAAEFELLLDVAQQLEEDGYVKLIFSRTFAFCCSFALALRLSDVQCKLQLLVLNDFYFPAKYSSDAFDSADYFFDVWNKEINVNQQVLLGCLVFFVVCFVVPRKMLFLVTLVSGVLLVVPILVKPANSATLYPEDSTGLAKIAIFCHLIAYAGVKPLVFIMPTEVFPAALRELGVAAMLSIYYIMTDMEHKFGEDQIYYFGTTQQLDKKIIYLCLAFSLVGIPNVMFFMPEALGSTAYDFREINLFPFVEDVDEDTLEELEEG